MVRQHDAEHVPRRAGADARIAGERRAAELAALVLDLEFRAGLRDREAAAAEIARGRIGQAFVATAEFLARGLRAGRNRKSGPGQNAGDGDAAFMLLHVSPPLPVVAPRRLLSPAE